MSSASTSNSSLEAAGLAGSGTGKKEKKQMTLQFKRKSSDDEDPNKPPEPSKLELVEDVPARTLSTACQGQELKMSWDGFCYRANAFKEGSAETNRVLLTMPSVCHSLLVSEYKNNCQVTANGCWKSTRLGNKPGNEDHSYVQVGIYGSVKSPVLHKIAYVGSQVSLPALIPPDPNSGMHVSHLCGVSKCFNPAHLVIEDEVANNLRKGCKVWILCPHANVHTAAQPGIIWLCDHDPYCVRACPQYQNEDMNTLKSHACN